MSEPTRREDLLRSIVLFASRGKIDAGQALLALEKILGPGNAAVDMGVLLEALRRENDPALAPIAQALQEARRRDAMEVHRLRASGLPVPPEMFSSVADLPLDAPLRWESPQIDLPPFRAALTILRDRWRALADKERLPLADVERAWSRSADRIAGVGGFWTPTMLARLAEAARLPGQKFGALREQHVERARKLLDQRATTIPGDLDEEIFLSELKARFAQTEQPGERAALLDLALRWPGLAAAQVIPDLVTTPEAEDRAVLVLSLRFGLPHATWQAWKQQIQKQIRSREIALQMLDRMVESAPAALLYLWASRQADIEPSVLEAIEKRAQETLGPSSIEEFRERWAFVETPRALPTVKAPPAPPKPSFWDVHVRPFLTENWYIVAGVVMIVVGSILLANYTWDKHWLVRYTLMPALLGAFTAALAWLGGWIERRDATFKVTAAILRSASIGLLPVNFMAVFLLAADQQVSPSQKPLALAAMSLAYLTLFGLGLKRWCAAVHPSLGWMLGGTLLFIDSIIIGSAWLPAITQNHANLGVQLAFYAGFGALALAVVRFARRTLNAELAEDRRVLWFFGASLSLTFLQVFAWIHGVMGKPEVHTYGPMVVGAGWLILFVERRTQELRTTGGQIGAESFLGYACILLGVLMGIGEEHIRIACLLLASVAWIYQALPRSQPVQHWVGLTFALLAAASVGLMDGFPRGWWPALGIGTCLAFGGLAWAARSRPDLSRAAAGLQMAALFLTLCVAVFAHLEFRTPPERTALFVAAVAALFGVRAWRDRSLAWLHTAMLVLALVPPYVGGVDWPRNALRPSFAVFALGVLSFAWIAAVAVSGSQFMRNARSTVLMLYGLLATACMAAWVGFDMPGGPLWMNFGGPPMITAALVFATWYSRSLIPAGMAMLVAVIFMPELKTEVVQLLPQIEWGTGLGSAAAAIGLLIAAFVLRGLPGLKALPEGDLYFGREPFPLRRLDHTLFTWPLAAGAFFLIASVDTWTLIRNVVHHNEIPLKCAVALILSGAAWTLLAVFARRRAWAIVASYLGIAWIVIGAALVFPKIVPKAGWYDTALAVGLLVQAIFFAYRFWLDAKDGLLTKPVRFLLRGGSLILTTFCVVGLIADDPKPLLPLTLFIAAQLIWHGLASRNFTFGGFLFALVWTALSTWPDGLNPDSLAAWTPTLWLIIGVQIARVALERASEIRDFLRPLTTPFWVAATAIAIASGVVGLGNAGHGLTTAQLALILAAVALTARSLSSGPLALLAALVAYVLIHMPNPNPELLVSPWRASLFGLVLAVLGSAGVWLHRRWPAVLASPLTPAWMRWPAAPWLYVPAVVTACAIAIFHLARPDLRDSAQHVAVGYIGAVTIGIVAVAAKMLGLAYLAGVLMTLSNIHVIRVFGGAWLIKHGLSELHLIALGMAATLIEGSLIRRLLRRADVDVIVRRSGLAWAAAILLLISAHYLTHPDLASIPAFRFGVSGAMALLASLYFRRAARRPLPGEEPYAKWCEGVHHFGLTMAIWCAALMIPWLRTPVTAIVGLGLPVLYFYARAEMAFQNGQAVERYRNSAAVVGFLVLALYMLRAPAQMVIFPGTPFETNYYHANAPAIFALGLILLRLRALGGTGWLAFYGGLAVMGGAYMALTSLRGLSPFEHPVAGAWCALVLAHFFTLASVHRSPLRTGVQRLCGLNDDAWHALRRSWGVCLLGASQALVAWGVFGLDGVDARPLMAAPLLAGAATVFFHHGALRGSTACYVFGAIELAVALHLGFVMPSYLPREHVVWVLLGAWAALLIAHKVASAKPSLGAFAWIFVGAVFAHVLWHHPSSQVGLCAMACGGILLLLTPRRTQAIENAFDAIGAAIPLMVPTWFVYFSQAPLLTRDIEGAVLPWPLLTAAVAIFATGAVAGILENGIASTWLARGGHTPRLFDQSMSLMASQGRRIHLATLWMAFVIAAGVQISRIGGLFEVREVLLIEALYGAFFAAWFIDASRRKSMASAFVLQACALGAFLVLRQHVLAPRGIWISTYDVWVSLAAFFALVGAREGTRGRLHWSIPINTALLVLPVFCASWVWLHHMGTGMQLLVVGLHSAAFAFLGRDDRESPYHFIGVAGFTAFVFLLFWSKLQLRMVYAYTIPAGIGTLVLLQLFRGRVPAEVRNAVRATVLLMMVASVGYSILMERRSITYHDLSLILVCLGAMGVGGVLKIRMYVAFGFVALMTDLAAIFVKTAAQMDRNVRMTVVGSLVLVLGALIVGGAIYWKANQAEMTRRLELLRRRFSGWE